ncbi:A-kinase anchor protein 8-like isoform X5 [Cynoglossus semilaevis]|uniref:A-kinase anchor protein 8-like isoform X5 n=1 Tax=Cynoglossus semilaevis TaxID=244447 RepID=UPI0007DC9224|nr:A-kinase anchor protein 8-like isoform X5 [Cynoglossus semilaevis]
MDRGYGSGFSGWGGSGSRGINADSVIAKINQRLDMLSQLEGGMRGSRGDRFDQYESYDSRTSSLASSRDLYRSGAGSYGYLDDRGDSLLFGQRGGSGFGGGMGLGGGGGGGGGGGFDSLSSSYTKIRQNMRDSFTSGLGGGSGGGGWAGAGRRSPRRGGSPGGRGAGGGFVSHRSDLAPSGGGRVTGSGGQSHRGHSAGGGYGRGKLPSLLSNRMYPESGGFHQGSTHGPQDYPRRHFGGGPRAGPQRVRKRPLNKQVKPQRDNQKKRKQMLTPTDEPESKINRTETESKESEVTPGTSSVQEQVEKNGEASEPQAPADETKPDEEGDNAANTPDAKKKLQGKDKHPKRKKRQGFVERGMFACSVCKFRSFYKDDMEAHLESRFHKDHFKFLSGQLSKPTSEFLQEYLQNKFKKIEKRISQMEHHSDAICQLYKEQDLTRDIGMEHFMRKVEAAHCAACDLFIPMQPHLIQKHIRSPDHNYNRKGMMEQSKRACVSVARSILNHKFISKKLELYIKGENPFTGNHDDQDPEDSMLMDVSEMELTNETLDGQTDSAQTQEEPASQEDVGEEAEAEAETDAAAEEVKMEEEQHIAGEEEGFEVGEEEEEEGGYVIHDEVGEEELGEAEDEGLETGDVEDEELNQE